jgi:hypothetical protein
MIFCGQCGLQLASGSMRCPRCGAIIEETSKQAGELHSDDPTVATPSLQNQPSALTQQAPLTQSPPNQPPLTQSPLILRPSSNPGGTQTPYNNYDETSMMERSNPPLAPQMGNSYAGYPPPGYPSQQSGSSYPSQSGGNYPPQNMYPAEYATSTNTNNYPGMSYPNMQPPGMQPQMGSYPSTHGQYQQDEHAARAARGRTTGLVLVLCGLIFVLGAVILFALQIHII